MKNAILQIAALAARILPAPLKRALYHLGPLTQTLRGLLNRAVPDKPTDVVIAGGALIGAQLRLDLQQEKDLWLGTYEPDLQQALQTLARPGMVAYDVGANIGYFTLLLVRLVGEAGQVFAFEPLPANLERLRGHLAMNGLAQTVEVVPAAVGDEMGQARFLVHASRAMGKVQGAAGRNVRYEEALQVPLISLDAFVYEQGNPAPDLVKMDIEGGEVLALAGMHRLLRQTGPLLLLELHGAEASRTAWSTLQEAGYSLHHMRPDFPPVHTADRLDWKAYVVGLPPGFEAGA